MTLKEIELEADAANLEIYCHSAARELGIRAYRAGLRPNYNPFTQPSLRLAWQAAWDAENYKEVERVRRREIDK